MHDPILVGIPEGAAMIGHGRSFIYELIAAGQLDARKAGKRTLLTVESLRRYAASLPKADIANSAAA